MKVSDLILELQRLDPEAPVRTGVQCANDTAYSDPGEVRVGTTEDGTVSLVGWASDTDFTVETVDDGGDDEPD